MGNRYGRGTLVLYRFILKRDRLRLPLWLVPLIAVTVIIAYVFTNMYPTAIERQALGATLRNPAMTAMVGPGYGLDNYTFGALLSHEMLLMTAVVVGLMNILLLSRHTRSNEEDGQLELMRSLPVGRLSNLLAVLLMMFSANLVLAVSTAVSLLMLNIESIDFEGSLVYGFALGAVGMVFASITAVFNQLSQSSRGAIGLSIAFLVLAYIARAIGDLSSETLSLLSPLGLILRTQAFVSNDWWPIAVSIVIAFVLALIALYLNAIRDMGSSFLPTRAGKPHASRMLTNPLGLAFRLQRTGLISWAVGMFVLGASYGSVLGEMETFFESVGFIQDLIVQQTGFTLMEQFIPVLMSVMGIFGTIPALMAVLKVKGEETNGRLEHILSKSVSRNRLLSGYVLLAIITSVVSLGLAGIGLGGMGISTIDEPMPITLFLKSAMVYLPALWVMIGLAVLLIGWAPRLTSLIWLYVAFSFIVNYFGELFEFPLWLQQLTPYGYVARVPVEAINYVDVTLLIATAALLMFIGFIGFNRRDISQS